MIFPEEDRDSVSKRFAEKYIPEPNSGCWLWTASLKNKNGYGQFQLRHKRGNGPDYAHRVSYELHCGPIPDGKIVLHSCDNPYCVNPDHLSVGTVKDNAKDMINRNRGRGQYSPGGVSKHTKLSSDAIARIRKDGRKHKQIADEYGVSECHISHVKRGERRQAG